MELLEFKTEILDKYNPRKHYVFCGESIVNPWDLCITTILQNHIVLKLKAIKLTQEIFELKELKGCYAIKMDSDGTWWKHFMKLSTDSMYDTFDILNLDIDYTGDWKDSIYYNEGLNK